MSAKYFKHITYYTEQFCGFIIITGLDFQKQLMLVAFILFDVRIKQFITRNLEKIYQRIETIKFGITAKIFDIQYSFAI